jgi:hypothetical protein
MQELKIRFPQGGIGAPRVNALGGPGDAASSDTNKAQDKYGNGIAHNNITTNNSHQYSAQSTNAVSGSSYRPSAADYNESNGAPTNTTGPL